MCMHVCVGVGVVCDYVVGFSHEAGSKATQHQGCLEGAVLWHSIRPLSGGSGLGQLGQGVPASEPFLHASPFTPFHI